jgi:sugar fermentation stimulation protein A
LAISVPIPGPLRSARLVDRPNRFLVRVALEPEGEVITAHLADPGRLTDMLVEGSQVFVRAIEDDGARKTKWTAALVSAQGTLVSLDTTLPNRLIKQALDRDEIEELHGWMIDRAEAPIGHSRFDYLLKNASGEQLVLEIKSVTMMQRGVGLFPDAPTDRGTRHLKQLIEIQGQVGWHAAVLFVVQRVDVEKVSAATAIDPNFARALEEAKKAGVRIMAKRCQVTLEEIVLGITVPVV